MEREEFEELIARIGVGLIAIPFLIYCLYQAERAKTEQRIDSTQYSPPSKIELLVTNVR